MTKMIKRIVGNFRINALYSIFRNPCSTGNRPCRNQTAEHYNAIRNMTLNTDTWPSDDRLLR